MRHFRPLAFCVACATTVGSIAQVLPRPRTAVPGMASDARRTAVLSAPAYWVPTVTSAEDTTSFTVLTNTSLSPRMEYTLESFEKFQRENQLILDQSQTPAPPNLLPVPFSVAWADTTNSGDSSAPLDNTVAHGNDDWVVSITNGVVDIRRSGRLRFRKNLHAFLDRKLTGPCDPKVLVDPTNQRFVLFAQKCDNQHALSEVLVGFSRTMNPMEGWVLYKLSGNPNGVQGQWFDYPKMALSSDGLYITGNLFDAQDQFVESVVYQIDKQKGFAGAPLEYRVWSGLPASPFTVVPVSSVTDAIHGPGIYLLSTNWLHGTDRVHLYEITGDLHDANTELLYHAVTSSAPYYFFDKAVQHGRVVDNGDLRMQDAFLHENRIHYAFTSGDGRRNFSRVNLNVLELPALRNTSLLVGDERNTSYAYPSIQLLKPPGRPAFVLVQYNASSATSFPGIKCKACDLDLARCSDEQTLREGDGLILHHDRWGDYSTISRSTPAGEYVYTASSFGSATGGRATWMTLITPLGIPGPRIKDQPLALSTFRFSLPQTTNALVTLHRPGRSSTLLYSGEVAKGANELQFVLPEGVDPGSVTISVDDLEKNKVVKAERISP